MAKQPRSGGGRNDAHRSRTSGNRPRQAQAGGGGSAGRGGRPRTEGGEARRREQLRVTGTAGGDLPKWIREEVQRSTAKVKRDATLNLLSEAADAFAEARYPQALQRLLKAKELSSRAPTIRELLGLTYYRMGKWHEALQELRAYRRIIGDTTHMAVEMDCLRGLGRDQDIEKVWALFGELGGSAAAESEMRVVYGSWLLDRGRPRDAWAVTNPRRIRDDAREWDLRQWYVAARAATALGDVETARQLATAIEKRDLAFPGLEELHTEIQAAG